MRGPWTWKFDNSIVAYILFATFIIFKEHRFGFKILNRSISLIVVCPLGRTQLCKFLQCVDLKTMGGAPPPPCSPPPLAPFPLYSSSSSSSSCSWMVSSPGPAAQQPRQLSFTASSGRPPVLQTTHHPIIRVVSFYASFSISDLSTSL